MRVATGKLSLVGFLPKAFSAIKRSLHGFDRAGDAVFVKWENPPNPGRLRPPQASSNSRQADFTPVLCL